MAAAEEWCARAPDASPSLALRKLGHPEPDDSAARRLTEGDAHFGLKAELNWLQCSVTEMTYFEDSEVIERRENFTIFDYQRFAI
ncbi:hypothetical protein [Xanthobacter autotrophicus]|uniref:hypothetical protein n=1 Tax=Xanthobacter autotrophicus TaxID=280 RepID=UPI0024A64AB6|nr:hypothetical protein [Xanthobacter autotrophicus]MDI4657976.1 hypothetical protein [Xanthobacter autotrophicus]